MSAGTLKLVIDQGATYKNTLTWLDSTSSPVDLTGYSAQMQIKASEKSSAALIELTDVNGRIILGTTGGTIVLSLTPAETAALTFSKASYDLFLTDSSGAATRLVQGAVQLNKSITK